MSTLRTNTIGNVAGTQSTDVLNVINGSAKAWVNFNGTGTVAIRQAYNVSSITDNGAGDYTVNYTNAFADSNYCATVGFTSRPVASGVNLAVGFWTTGNTAELFSATQLRLLVKLAGGTSEDIGNICVACFR